MNAKTRHQSAGKCPFNHIAGVGRTNRDWWPNQLRLALLHQQRSEITGDCVREGDLDKDQGVVGEGRVEEGETAAVVLEAAAQVVPAADFMDSFVANELLKERGAGVPVDAGDAQRMELAHGIVVGTPG